MKRTSYQTFINTETKKEDTTVKEKIQMAANWSSKKKDNKKGKNTDSPTTATNVLYRSKKKEKKTDYVHGLYFIAVD